MYQGPYENCPICFFIVNVIQILGSRIHFLGTDFLADMEHIHHSRGMEGVAEGELSQEVVEGLYKIMLIHK